MLSLWKILMKYFCFLVSALKKHWNLWYVEAVVVFHGQVEANIYVQAYYLFLCFRQCRTTTNTTWKGLFSLVKENNLFLSLHIPTYICKSLCIYFFVVQWLKCHKIWDFYLSSLVLLALTFTLLGLIISTPTYHWFTFYSISFSLPYQCIWYILGKLPGFVL